MPFILDENDEPILDENENFILDGPGLAGQVAEVAGIGASASTGVGDLDASAADITGVAEISAVMLVAQAASISGIGISSSAGTGLLVAGDGNIIGHEELGTPTWPSTLNALPTEALAPNLTIAPLNEISRAEMDRGPPRLRPRFTSMPRRLNFELVMTPVEFAVMKGFYDGTLRHGTMQFHMPLWNGEAYVDMRARFSEPYEATDFAPDLVRVQMNLVTFEDLP